MRKIPSSDFEKFLRLVDEELAEPFTIIVVSPLSLATLISRYEESRPQFIGNPANLKLSFLALVARLFGEKEARRVETEIRWVRAPGLCATLAP